MQKNNFKSHLQLHLIVFIWGFTAILGKLITIESIQLVWYRMFLASLFLFVYLLISKKEIKISIKDSLQFAFVGLLIALHWITFFHAIKVSNVSITLAIFSTGSFFGSLLEPLFYKRRVIVYEVFFGLIIIGGLFLIMNVEVRYLKGIFYALFSIILGVLFTIYNGKLIQKQDSGVITMYEFLAGVFFISLYMIVNQNFTSHFFNLSIHNLMLLLLLSSICTAYAFTASVKVMKQLSPYTVLLTTNLEPVYGIFLAYFIFDEKEKMSTAFYIGALVIVTTVILNALVKHYFEKEI
jgi:drug/metabolite transporter (DMT)-like permease